MTHNHQRDWFWRGWNIRYSYSRSLSDPTATPVILLHGFGAGLGHWRHNIPILAEDRTVYALDLLGFGASRKAFTLYNIDLWSKQIYDFWQVFIKCPVFLVGNSLGSLVCLNLAATYPDMIKGVIMISLPDPSVEWEMIPVSLHSLVSTIKGFFTSSLLIKPIFYFVRQNSIIKSALLTAYPHNENVDDQLINIIIKPTYDQGASGALCAITKSSMMSNYSPSVKAILPQINLPMLLLWGESDRLIPPIFADTLVKLNANLKLQKLSGLGHCPHDESPEIVNPIMINWLREIDN